MPFVDTTVKDINALLLTSIFSKGKLQGSKLLELGYIQKKDSDPVEYKVMSVAGESFAPDDSYPCVIYHRMLSATFLEHTDSKGPVGFGDDQFGTKEPTQMTLIVWAKRTIGIHESTLASWIADTLNKSYSVGNSGLSQLKTRATSVTYDSTQVWANEYKNQNYPFGIEEVMFFSIQYVIESTYTKGCFATCPDC